MMRRRKMKRKPKENVWKWEGVVKEKTRNNQKINKKRSKNISTEKRGKGKEDVKGFDPQSSIQKKREEDQRCLVFVFWWFWVFNQWRGFILSMVLDFLSFLSFFDPNSFFFFFLTMTWEAGGTGSREDRKEVMRLSTILKTVARSSRT